MQANAGWAPYFHGASGARGTIGSETDRSKAASGAAAWCLGAWRSSRTAETYAARRRTLRVARLVCCMLHSAVLCALHFACIPTRNLPLVVEAHARTLCFAAVAAASEAIVRAKAPKNETPWSGVRERCRAWERLCAMHAPCVPARRRAGAF